MGAYWRVLELGVLTSNLPPILIKHEVENSSYAIYLSDLTYIWKERMSAKDIRRRALNSDTSIDPSEDHDQMRLFLRCIDDALEQKPGTSVNLGYDEHSEILLLQTRTTLPGSLEPLRWHMELTLETSFVMTREMIIPLLRQQAFQNAESASLFQQLKEKDHVIDKLIDTMQADGIVLSKAFPGAAPSKSAMKTSPRQAFSKTARGLSEFSEQQWRRDLNSHAARPSGLNQLVSNVFQANPSNDQEMVLFPEYGKWWLNMRNDGSNQKKSYNESQTRVEEGQAMAGDSQFQRQLTPPKLQRASLKQTIVDEQTNAKPQQSSNTTPAADESTTDDDNDLAATAVLKPTKSDAQSHRKGQDVPIQDLTSRPNEDESKSSEPAAAPIGSDGRSESRAERIANSKFTYDSRVFKKGAKVGKIGGKAKADPMDNLEPSQSINSPFEQPKSEQDNRQISTSNGSPVRSSPAVEPERRSIALNKQKSPSPAREETEKERADRNREQIKRVLEAKAASPAKKKRRF